MQLLKLEGPDNHRLCHPLTADLIRTRGNIMQLNREKSNELATESDFPRSKFQRPTPLHCFIVLTQRPRSFDRPVRTVLP